MDISSFIFGVKPFFPSDTSEKRQSKHSILLLFHPQFEIQCWKIEKKKKEAIWLMSRMKKNKDQE